MEISTTLPGICTSGPQWFVHLDEGMRCISALQEGTDVPGLALSLWQREGEVFQG